MATDEGLIVASLDGRARYLIRNRVDRETCLAEVRALTTDPRLLGLAAGTALGAWRATRSHDSDKVERLLTAAGGDAAVRDAQAVVVVERLTRDAGRRDIGNPG